MSFLFIKELFVTVFAFNGWKIKMMRKIDDRGVFKESKKKFLERISIDHITFQQDIQTKKTAI